MEFTLETDEFTGPIELLLSLIEKRKLAINDISLSLVTDEFLSFVSRFGAHEKLADRIHFVYTASTLALIKTKSLLPNISLEEDEEVDILRLKQRLELHRAFQEQALFLSKKIHTKRQFFTALDRPQEVRFSPHEDVHSGSLFSALHDVLHELPEPRLQKKEAHVSLAIHIEEIMDRLIQRLGQQPKVNFNQHIREGKKDHSHKKQYKVYKVVSFLALLELVRNQGLNVRQELLFDDIHVTQE